jgi:hypothetical protein
MTLYTVLAPPPPPGSAAPEPTEFVFVKEGFCWPALWVPEFWLLFRRLWLVLLVDFAFILAMMALADTVGGPVPTLLLLLERFYLALEGNGLRRWTLERRGFGFIGVVEGRSMREAEIRFFHDFEPPPSPAPAEPQPSPPAASPPPPAGRTSPETTEVIGLFPAPGGGT